MYPNLVAPLLTLFGIVAVFVAAIGFGRRVPRRLAVRQIARRRTEAVLTVVGCTLGIAIIVAALVVGDTLDMSVRRQAYDTLGSVDERVLTTSAAVGDEVAARLSGIAGDPLFDGVLSGHADQAAAVAHDVGGDLAEPRVLAWDLDLPAAEAFGAAAAPSGLAGANPSPDRVVVNEPLAAALDLAPGDSLTLYLYGSPRDLVVDRVVPEHGLAGVGLGATTNRNVFLAPGTLTAAAQAAHTAPKAVTFVSNAGGVETGAGHTDAALNAIRTALGPVADHVMIEAPKRTVLDAAQETAAVLGALFLMIGSFSIIAGALLVMNIFVMLADERKAQLGILRAVGMTRSTLVGTFAVEGASYAAVSVIPGAALGIAVGWAVSAIAAKIFSSWSADGSTMDLHFAVTRTSLINGCALGVVIAGSAILLISVRISRFNIIAAIRDLPRSPVRRAHRYAAPMAAVLAAVVATAAVPVVAASDPVLTYLLPSAAAVLLLPVLNRSLGHRWSITLVGGFVASWGLAANLVRPAILDTPSMAAYIVQGSLVAFAAVAVLSVNQAVLLAPLRRVFERPSDTGLALHLAAAYPLARPLRTGATLVMYTLITMVLVMLVEMSAIFETGLDKTVAESSAGYAIRVDLNPEQARGTVDALRRDDALTEVTELTSAPALATDPGRRSAEPLRAVAIGVPDGSLAGMKFTDRLPGLDTDEAVWAAIAANPAYVAVDAYFGSSGGPAGRFFAPGDQFTLRDPATGRSTTVTIAGVLSNGMMFYPATGDGGRAWPVVSSEHSVTTTFGENARVTGALLRAAPGTDAVRLAATLQAAHIASSLVATPIEANLRKLFAANTAFFRLMQGFLALGLLIGITGLGVVMVRAVHERRRTIGVLRALGFRAATLARSFLLESGIIATEGVVLGSLLGTATMWMMYANGRALQGFQAGFPIEWLVISVIAGTTLLASLAATVGPARRAAAIQPALAVRVAT
ncbi:putative ABC transport system permease protein [Nocardia transvalensis]|uniref:Putative ABC transport system permease protein n=1 Tax=Nocardia transvalensis TaxID=37333 RepID=A0A7W9PID6_9NOCA|nr:ABC transporter permease [Nocardia transvalensis]MBB5916747.1 putative ABC transport system permease protein [Nocardia transvalensis]